MSLAGAIGVVVESDDMFVDFALEPRQKAKGDDKPKSFNGERAI